jgi:hypothetical protein
MKLSTEVLDDNLAAYIEYCLKNSPPFRPYELYTESQVAKAFSLKELCYHDKFDSKYMSSPVYVVTHIPSGVTVDEFYTEKEAKLFCQMMYFSDFDWDFKDYDVLTFSHEQKELLRKTLTLFSSNQSLVYYLGCFN